MQKKAVGLYIFGRKPIEEALLTDPKNVKMVYVKESVKEGDLTEVRKYLARHKIPITRVPENKLVSLVGDIKTQGFVAELKEFKTLEFAEWIETVDAPPSTDHLDGLQDFSRYSFEASDRGGIKHERYDQETQRC